MLYADLKGFHSYMKCCYYYFFPAKENTCTSDNAIQIYTKIVDDVFHSNTYIRLINPGYNVENSQI